MEESLQPQNKRISSRLQILHSPQSRDFLKLKERAQLAWVPHRRLHQRILCHHNSTHLMGNQEREKKKNLVNYITVKLLSFQSKNLSKQKGRFSEVAIYVIKIYQTYVTSSLLFLKGLSLEGQPYLPPLTCHTEFIQEIFKL